ncbi:unnamed protein product, partial [Heterotrigona itama]
MLAFASGTVVLNRPIQLSAGCVDDSFPASYRVRETEISRRAMGEVCSILETVDGWINRLKPSAFNKSTKVQKIPEETKIITIETNDTTTPEHETWRQDFLVDSPVLRRLLLDVPTENNIFEIICTINRLVFFYVIVKWFNYEVWILAGAEPFVLNR